MTQTTRIKKAIFPVAGLGTRFLPATKACPKEMLPVVDKPLIQYAVEEAVNAGITDLIFITGRNKRAIEDHFDTAFELEAELAASKKDALLDIVRSVRPERINLIFIRQHRPLGLGHAVLCAEPVVGDEPFAVVLADDLIDSSQPVLGQMADRFDVHRCSMLGVQAVPLEDTQAYGIVQSEPYLDRLDVVKAIVEKPAPEVAPSTTAVIGRYLLTPRIFHHLARIEHQASKEIQLTDAISALLAEDRVLAYHFEGKRYDCGSKSGYLEATVAYGLQHSEVGPAFRAYLAGLKPTTEER